MKNQKYLSFIDRRSKKVKLTIYIDSDNRKVTLYHGAATPVIANTKVAKQTIMYHYNKFAEMGYETKEIFEDSENDMVM